MKKAPFLTAVIYILTLTACASSTTSKQVSTASEQVSTEEQTSASSVTEAENHQYKYQKYAKMSANDIVSSLTLEQKAAQMVQPAVYSVDETKMGKNDYGSIISKYSAVDYKGWQKIVDGFQKAAIESDSGIPYLYGQDDVHGVNYCDNAVIFPHNIGMGAANDPELMYQVGLITADEAKLCHMLWNFAPCVAQVLALSEPPQEVPPAPALPDS